MQNTILTLVLQSRRMDGFSFDIYLSIPLFLNVYHFFFFFVYHFYNLQKLFKETKNHNISV